MRVSARDLIASSDPLSDEACVGLLIYGEEDELVDFKQTFDLRLSDLGFLTMVEHACREVNWEQHAKDWNF
jgi:hypothetical protein